MERGSRDLSGAENGTSGGGDEEDKNIARSHRVNESEEEELSDSESVETISTARISPGGPRIVEAIEKRQADTILTILIECRGKRDEELREK